jgi:hypothetical protein
LRLEKYFLGSENKERGGRVDEVDMVDGVGRKGQVRRFHTVPMTSANALRIAVKLLFHQ